MTPLKTLCCFMLLILALTASAFASDASYEPDPKLIAYKNDISYQLNRAIENNYPVKVEAYQKQLNDIELRLKEDKRQWKIKRNQQRLEDSKNRKAEIQQRNYDRVYNKTMNDFAEADQQKARQKNIDERKTKQLENKKRVKEQRLKDKEEKAKQDKEKNKK